MAKTIVVMVHGEAASGKSTFIDSISEIHFQPDTSGMDLGRVYIGEDKYVYLFGNRGGKRFPELEKLNDPNRRYTCSVILNPSKTINGKRQYYEETKEIIDDALQRGIPFLIVSNRRNGIDSYSIGELCETLQTPETTRFLECDPVTEPASAKQVLIALLMLMPEDEFTRAAIEKLTAQNEEKL